MAIGDVTPAKVRAWHTEAAKVTGATALAQAYRLLRSLLGVAVADEVIAANPCRLRNASTPKAARPSRALTAIEAQALADHLGADRRTERYRTLVLVLAFGGLRFGEATALRRVRRRRRGQAPGGALRALRGRPMARRRSQDRGRAADGHAAGQRGRGSRPPPRALRTRLSGRPGVRHVLRRFPVRGQLGPDLSSGRPRAWAFLPSDRTSCGTPAPRLPLRPVRRPRS